MYKLIFNKNAITIGTYVFTSTTISTKCLYYAPVNAHMKPPIERKSKYH